MSLRERSKHPMAGPALLIFVSMAAAATGTKYVRPAIAMVDREWTQYQIRGEIRHKWDTLVTTGSRLGDSAKPVAIVEFSDYECPFCRAANALVDSVLSDATVSVAYHHLPLEKLHPEANGAARAAICADEQGRFREMHHLLMTTMEWQRTRNWRNLAVVAGVKGLDAFNACLTSATTARRLESDSAFAASLRINGTPTFVTQNDTYLGAQELRATVASEEARRGSPTRR
jgi:protein-disulfide isomerase